MSKSNYTKLDGGLSCYKSIAIAGKDKNGVNNPTEFEGRYLATVREKSAFSKAPDGCTNKHVFQTPEGNVGVWGRGYLDTEMKKATVGMMIRIVFDGMAKALPGKAPGYKFDVRGDKNNVVDVSHLLTTSDPVYNTSPGTVYEDDTDEDNDENPDAYEAVAPRATPPRTAAQTPTAESQARTKAILNGAGRNKNAG